MNPLDRMTGTYEAAEPVRRQRSRRALLLMAALCLAPVLGAWLAYRWMPPQGGHSYGVLLPTRPFAAQGVPGWPAGKWVMVRVEDLRCDAACEARARTLRQLRLAQGEAAEQVARVVLRTDDHPASAAEGEIALSVPGLKVTSGGFTLVDPLGNQVMFYPDDADPARVMGEMTRLFKTNNALAGRAGETP